MPNNFYALKPTILQKSRGDNWVLIKLTNVFRTPLVVYLEQSSSFYANYVDVGLSTIHTQVTF
jgi:hypothetical protein